MILVCLFYGHSMSLIIFVTLLCIYAVLLYPFCEWMAPGMCRVEGIGKLCVYSGLTDFCFTLSLILSPNSSFDFSRALCYFYSWKYLQWLWDLWRLHPNLSCILRLYPSSEAILHLFGIILFNFFYVFLAELLLTFYWPVAQHSGIFL